MDAHDRADAEAIAELLGDEMRFTMPPQPVLIEGPDAFVRMIAEEGFGPNGVDEFRLVPTRANRQLAAANYVRTPGDAVFRAMSLDVLRIDRGRLVEVTTFEPHLFPAFGLASRL
jgi:RNA polymerase sigma-70 factor, ECF subfamily